MTENERSPGQGGWLVAVISVSLLVAVVAGGALWIVHLNNRPGGQAAPAAGAPGGMGGGAGGGGMKVQFATVIQRTVADSIELPATVEPIRSAVVGGEIAGRVKTVHLRDGDDVAANQVIVELDHDLMDLEQAQAESVLKSLDEKAKSLQAQLTQAQFEYDRLAGLQQENKATQREVVIAKSVCDSAHAQFAQAQADTRAQSDRIAYIKRQIEKTMIRSPFDGQVTQLLTEQGEWLAVGSPVVQVTDLHELLVVSNMPDRLIGGIQPGMDATVRLPDVSGVRSVAGKIRWVIDRGDAQAHTFPVKVLLTNDSRRTIKPGVFASCLFTIGQPHPRLLVPQAAVVSIRVGGGPAYDAIYTLGPPPGMPMGAGGPPGAGKPATDAAVGGGAPAAMPAMPLMAIRTPVLSGAFYGDWQVVVCDGLKAGDRVVVRGNETFAAIPAPMLPVEITGESTSAQLPPDLVPTTQPQAEPGPAAPQPAGGSSADALRPASVAEVRRP
ncbi:MAG: Multidrug resistance protein MdtA [Phycisphaerae bacterium]|nr:Multidrug resistance protein MdtA [Phycisphaerae bacterium]